MGRPILHRPLSCLYRGPLLGTERESLQSWGIRRRARATDHVERLLVFLTVYSTRHTYRIGDRLSRGHGQWTPGSIAFERDGCKSIGGVGVEGVVVNDRAMALQFYKGLRNDHIDWILVIFLWSRGNAMRKKVVEFFEETSRRRIS
jgi:hypothetical protein